MVLRKGSGIQSNVPLGRTRPQSRPYCEHLDGHRELVEQAREELTGYDLACYCAPELPCRVDVLLDPVSCSPCFFAR